MKMKKHVLFTDGHHVTVTDSALVVRKTWYDLSAIKKHGLAIIKPPKLPGVVVMILGLAISVVGGEGLFPNKFISFYGVLTNLNQLASIFGIFILSFGGWLLWSTDERYALSITTEEGERNVVISSKRDYIIEIVRSLNSALFNRIQTELKPPDNGFQVSAR